MKEYIKKLTNNMDLTEGETTLGIKSMLNGTSNDAQMAAFLTALKMKGETKEEIIGSVKALDSFASKITPKHNNYMDIVGTGGDGTNTFNISTTTAFVLAGAGLPIAKHGNTAVSSRSGSGDVLEALGVNIMLEPEKVQYCVDNIGIGFMFAKVFHSKMKNVSQVRNSLGIRSVFNLIGPLVNPSSSKNQMIGIYSKDLLDVYIEIMRDLGVENALVIAGADKMDEITTTTYTYGRILRNNIITPIKINPQDFSVPLCSPEDLKGGDARDNGKITLDILNGQRGAKRDIVLLNAAYGLYIGNMVSTPLDGFKLAEKSIDEGHALNKLQELIKLSNSL